MTNVCSVAFMWINYSLLTIIRVVCTLLIHVDVEDEQSLYKSGTFPPAQSDGFKSKQPG